MSCGSIPLRSVHCVFSLLPSSTHRVQCTQQTTQCTLIIFCMKLQKPNSTPIIHAPRLRCSIHPIVVEIFRSQLVHRPTWPPLEPPLHTGLVSPSSTDVLSHGIFIYHPTALPPITSTHLCLCSVNNRFLNLTNWRLCLNLTKLLFHVNHMLGKLYGRKALRAERVHSQVSLYWMLDEHMDKDGALGLKSGLIASVHGTRGRSKMELTFAQAKKKSRSVQDQFHANVKDAFMYAGGDGYVVSYKLSHL